MSLLRAGLLEVCRMVTPAALFWWPRQATWLSPYPNGEEIDSTCLVRETEKLLAKSVAMGQT